MHTSTTPSLDDSIMKLRKLLSDQADTAVMMRGLSAV